jgi:tetratricopeptide (TPR) repeat protein
MHNLKAVVMVMCILAVACLWVGCGKDEDGGKQGVGPKGGNQASPPKQSGNGEVETPKPPVVEKQPAYKTKEWVVAAEKELKTVASNNHADIPWGELARLKALLGDNDGARKALENLKGKYAMRERYPVVAAALAQSGDLPAAMALMSKLGYYASGRMRAIASVLVSQGKLAQVETLVKADDKVGKIQVNAAVAKALAKQGDVEGALVALKKTKHSFYEVAQYEMVGILARRGDFVNAAKIAKEIRQSSFQKRAARDIAEAKLVRKMLDVAFYPKAYQMQGNRYSAPQGLTWPRDRNLREAIWSNLASALKAGPNASVRRSALGSIVTAADNAPRTRNGEKASAAKTYLHAAAAYQHFGDNTAAEKMVGKALATYRFDPRIITGTVVTLLTRMGNMQAMVEEVNKSDVWQTYQCLGARSAGYAQVMFAVDKIDDGWVKGLTRPINRAEAYLGMAAAAIDRQAKKK